jgi:hypothetical protein
MHSRVMETLRPRPLYYMTHRQQEAMGMPVGDPMRGPAYGERRGPAIAVFGAFGSISAGLAAGGLMGGLMIAGGVMSGLGAITGNKTLSSLGMLAGLAGGVGQFFQQGGFDSFSQAYQADGVNGVVDQFTGNADYSYGYPGNDVPGLDPASQALQDAGSASRAQQIINDASPTIGGADQAFGVRDANGGGLLGDGAEAAAASATPQSGVQIPIPTANAAAAASPATKETGLLGMWKNQGDFTKMALVNAGAGALKGMAEADTNDQLLELKKSSTEANNQLTEAQTAAIEKKNAGVPMASLGSFGSNTSAAFGKNASGANRTYAEYIADRTAAMQRLFGTQQAAPAA